MPGLPGGGLARRHAEEGRHCRSQVGGVEIGLALNVARPDQRERHRRPVHLRKAGQLLAHLAVAVLLVGLVHAGLFEQAVHRLLALALQPGAHRSFALRGQRTGLSAGHDCDKAVWQRGGKQRVGIGGTLRPLTVGKPVGRQTAFIAQPQINLRHAAQPREQDGIWPQRLAQRLHGLPGQAGQQMRAGPQVRGGARGFDETLHRAECQGQQGRLVVGVGSKRAGKGRGQVKVVPDAVVGHAGIGR